MAASGKIPSLPELSPAPMVHGMGRQVLGVLLAFALVFTANVARPTEPTPSTEAMKKELAKVIEAQLAAFRAEDYTRAYTFAAAGIKDMVNAVEFERMVKAGYPVIAHSASAEYGLTLDSGEEAVVNVRVISAADGQAVDYLYTLGKEEGGWKITGVSELRREPSSRA